MTTTPLHDGAVIIQGDRVACASAYFPPTNVNLSSRYGARHRAALGIAEVSDCLTIVVSEETSTISIAEKGRIFSVDEKQLRDYLRRVICNDTTTIEKGSRRRNSLLMEDDVVVEIRDEKENRRNFSLFRKNENAEEDKNGEPDMKVPFNNRRKQEKGAERKAMKEKEETLEIENNLMEEANDESAE